MLYLDVTGRRLITKLWLLLTRVYTTMTMAVSTALGDSHHVTVPAAESDWSPACDSVISCCAGVIGWTSRSRVGWDRHGLSLSALGDRNSWGADTIGDRPEQLNIVVAIPILGRRGINCGRYTEDTVRDVSWKRVSLDQGIGYNYKPYESR